MCGRRLRQQQGPRRVWNSERPLGAQGKIWTPLPSTPVPASSLSSLLSNHASYVSPHAHVRREGVGHPAARIHIHASPQQPEQSCLLPPSCPYHPGRVFQCSLSPPRSRQFVCSRFPANTKTVFGNSSRPKTFWSANFRKSGIRVSCSKRFPLQPKSFPPLPSNLLHVLPSFP